MLLNPLLRGLERRGPDSHEGLRPLIGSFVVMLLISAGYKAQGVFFDAARREFNATRQEISWPMSLYQFSMNFSGLILGPLAEQFSVKSVTVVSSTLGALGFVLSYFATNYIHFSITYGLLGGIGFGGAMLAASVLMTLYFHKYRAIAIGIAFAGGAVGSFVFPSLLTALVAAYGLHTTLVINGVICALSVPVVLLTAKEPDWGGNPAALHSDASQSNGLPLEKPCQAEHSVKGTSSLPVYQKACLTTNSKTGFTTTSFIETVLSVNFWLLCVPMVCYYWANLACLTTIVDYHRTERGYPELEAVNLVTAFGVAELVGQLVLPHVCDHGLVLRETLMMACLVMAGGLLIALPMAPNFGVSIAMIAVLGPFYGLSATFYRCFVGEYIGLHRMKFAFGLLAAIKGACLLATPPFIGYFRDTLNDYHLMYNVCGGLLVAAGHIWVPAILKKRSVKPEETQSSKL